MSKSELLAVAKPVLFNTEMVRAIIDGRKKVTRRSPFQFEMKNGYNPNWSGYSLGEYCTGRIETGVCLYSRGAHGVWGVRSNVVKPKYNVGDILYVRETWGNWNYDDPDCDACYYQYRADYPNGAKTYEWGELDEFGEVIICDLPKWHPSIHMPKEATRIFLRVTNVRVERLQDITDEQVIKEGLSPFDDRCADENWKPTYSDPNSGGEPQLQQGFEILWDSTIKKSDLDRYGWNANPFVWVYEFERVIVDD